MVRMKSKTEEISGEEQRQILLIREIALKSIYNMDMMLKGIRFFISTQVRKQSFKTCICILGF